MENKLLTFIYSATFGGLISLSPLAVSAQSDFNAIEMKQPALRHLAYIYHTESPLTALTTINAATNHNPDYKSNNMLALMQSKLYLDLNYPQQAHELLHDTQVTTSQAEELKNQQLIRLADVYYQQQDYKQSLNILNKVTRNLSRELHEQKQLQIGMAHMALGEYSKASKILDKITGNSRTGSYARYNLGVTYFNMRNFNDGIEILEKLGQSNFRNEELKNLKDQANITLGFLFLRAQEPEMAKAYLSRVRLEATLSNRALLGMGWSSINDQQHKNALLPLLELHDRPKTDDTVVEAHLAIPYSLSKLRSNNHALDYYEQAVDLFEQQAKTIDQLIKQLTDDPLSIDTLLTPHPPIAPNSNDEIMARMINRLLQDATFTTTRNHLKKLSDLKNSAAHWEADYSQHHNAATYPVERKKLDALTNNLNKQLDDALNQQKALLSKIVLAMLSQENVKLNRNINNIRFSMAQIYDKILNQRVAP